MMKKTILTACRALVAVLLTQSAVAQFVILDSGSTSPTPGPNDVYAIYNSVQNNDGVNYYWDSNVGQTFTTGSNLGGYTLTNLAIKTAGNGGSWQVSQAFVLTIYSIDGNGNATPIQTNTATGALNLQGDWLQWNGLNVPLLPNTNYAYAFNRGNNSGWEQLANNGNDPYAGGQICHVPVGGGAVAYGGSGTSDAVFDLGLALGTVAAGTVTVADIGLTPPTPGPNDISQLSPTFVPMQNNYGLNYYWDSGPGQVFTTPSSSLPWVMTNLFIQSGGNGGGGELSSQAFVLRMYSVSATTATLIYSNSYTSTLNAQADWLQCSGMSVVLQPNQRYAYTLYRGANGSWEQMANYDDNPYSGGQICLIAPAGGTINYGSQSGNASADAAFDVGLTAPLVYATVPTCAPNVSPIYAGTHIRLNEAALGSGLSYQWQTDGGSGGSLTNIPSATSSNLVVDTTSFPAGTYNYAVTVTTTSGGGSSMTSATLPLAITAASAPVLVTDTTPSPNTTSSYVRLNQSFSTSFTGTLPISYQWYIATDGSGTGATAIAGATNATLTLINLQTASSGYYSVAATNVVSPYSATSSWAQLTVLPASQMLVHWQAPLTFDGLTASQILTGTLPTGFAFFEGAFFGNASSPINVTNNGVTYAFYGDGSTISLSGYDGTASGCWLVGGNTTGDTNLDQVLNQFDWDGSTGTHTITLHNLAIGSNYCVQIFALDDRAAGADRYATFQDPANNADVSGSFGMQDNKFVIGTFTASSTDVDIQQNLLPGGAGNTCAVIVGSVLAVDANAATANFKGTIAGPSLSFSWAPDHLGWQLYTNASGLTATGAWYPVAGSASVTNQTIAIDPSKTNVFFQLRYP